MRTCTKCNIEKDLSEFYIISRTKKPRAACKKCCNAGSRARAKAEPEKHNARLQAWREANPGRATKIVRAWQKRNPERYKENQRRYKYGIGFQALWDKQQGLCASCGRAMQPEGKDPESVTVDHDRSCCSGPKSCGKCVRGLIHRNCNLVLGYAKDDLQLLRSAIAYLERWEAAHSVNP